MASVNRLPDEATDRGDRVVLAPDRSTRVWAVALAVVAFGIGGLIVVTGDGIVVIAGVAALLAGAYLLVVQAQRLEFDADAVRRRSLVFPRRVLWTDVAAVTVAQRFVRTHAGGSARRLDGLTLSLGAGGSRRARGIRKDESFVELVIEPRGSGGNLKMELNRSDVPQAEALVATLGERDWLGDDVKITIDAQR